MFLLLLGTLAIQQSGQTEMPTPPIAKQNKHEIVLHGETLADPYFWLRNKDSKDVLDYLHAENAYAEAVMRDTKELQESLYEEMLGRIKQTDLSVPQPNNGYLYYSRTIEGKQYAVMCRKKGEDGAEQVILDVNELAEGQPFMSVSSVSVSEDTHLLAYATDNTGFRQYRLHVKDLRTGEVTPNIAERVTSVVWANDNKTLFYGTEDPVTKRSDRVFRHALGGEAVQVYEEPDALYRCGVSKSLDRRYLFIGSSCSENDEVWFLDASDPSGEFALIERRQGELEYSVEHRDGLFYIRTNKNNKDFEVITAPVATPSQENWRPFIPPIPAGTITRVTVFKDHLVYSKRQDGLPGIAIYDFKTKGTRDIPVDEAIYSIGLAGNEEYDTTKLRFSFASPVTSQSVYEIDMVTLDRVLLKQTEVLGGYDPGQYTSERLFATAPDGKRIPFAVIYRKDMKRPEGNPCVLYGYGSYGSSASFGFNSNLFSLLDRGFVWAIAQIRGGADMGIAWHDDGKMLNKRNTFTDFAACADELVYSGWTSRDRLAIQGGSAGGLLVGATINIRPDLCAAAVLHVPFVDVINTMLDESLPLTVGEFLEWGNPKVEEQYRYMRTYSPYENIRQTQYPHLLVKTSYNDSQVMYWEPAKYVARMRSVGEPRSLVFHTNMAGGHGGSSGRYDVLKERAFDYAWLIKRIGS